MKAKSPQPARSRVGSLVERFTRAYEAWDQAIGGLADDSYLSPNVSKQWNVKDVMAHLLAYNQLFVRNIRSFKRRKQLSSARAPSYSYFNRREAARFKSISLGEIRAALGVSKKELLDELESLNDEALRRQVKSPWTQSNYVTSLGTRLREEASHIEIHANDIRQWRAKHGL